MFIVRTVTRGDKTKKWIIILVPFINKKPPILTVKAVFSGVAGNRT